MNIFLIISVLISSFNNEVCMDGINGMAKKTVCQPPRILDNIDLHWEPSQPSYNVGERIVFDCFANKKVYGNHEAVCQKNGKFSSVPSCKPTQCLRPEKPHLIVSPKKSKYNLREVVSWKCDPGFRLIGKNTSSCGLYDVFKHVPYCIVSHCLLNEKDFAHIIIIKSVKKQLYDFGDQIELECRHPGYVMNGSTISTCMNDGSFTKFSKCIENPIVVTMRKQFLKQKHLIMGGIKEGNKNEIDNDMSTLWWTNIYLGFTFTILGVGICLLFIITNYREMMEQKKNYSQIILDDNMAEKISLYQVETYRG